MVGEMSLAGPRLALSSQQKGTLSAIKTLADFACYHERGCERGRDKPKGPETKSKLSLNKTHVSAKGHTPATSIFITIQHHSSNRGILDTAWTRKRCSVSRA